MILQYSLPVDQIAMVFAGIFESQYLLYETKDPVKNPFDSLRWSRALTRIVQNLRMSLPVVHRSEFESPCTSCKSSGRSNHQHHRYRRSYYWCTQLYFIHSIKPTSAKKFGILLRHGGMFAINSVCGRAVTASHTVYTYIED